MFASSWLFRPNLERRLAFVATVDKKKKKKTSLQLPFSNGKDKVFIQLSSGERKQISFRLKCCAVFAAAVLRPDGDLNSPGEWVTSFSGAKITGKRKYSAYPAVSLPRAVLQRR